MEPPGIPEEPPVELDVLMIDPATVPSAVLQRLIAEVQHEAAMPDDTLNTKKVYDRIHNRHNRGPYIPEPPRPL